jgi:hypothetical protein
VTLFGRCLPVGNKNVPHVMQRERRGTFRAVDTRDLHSAVAEACRQTGEINATKQRILKWIGFSCRPFCARHRYIRFCKR